MKFVRVQLPDRGLPVDVLKQDGVGWVRVGQRRVGVPSPGGPPVLISVSVKVVGATPPAGADAGVNTAALSAVAIAPGDAASTTYAPARPSEIPDPVSVPVNPRFDNCIVIALIPRKESVRVTPANGWIGAPFVVLCPEYRAGDRRPADGVGHRGRTIDRRWRGWGRAARVLKRKGRGHGGVHRARGRVKKQSCGVGLDVRG